MSFHFNKHLCYFISQLLLLCLKCVSEVTIPLHQHMTALGIGQLYKLSARNANLWIEHGTATMKTTLDGRHSAPQNVFAMPAKLKVNWTVVDKPVSCAVQVQEVVEVGYGPVLPVERHVFFAKRYRKRKY